MTKYRPLPQKKEMSHNQPIYWVPLTSSDLVEKGFLLVHIRKTTTIKRVDDEEQETCTQYLRHQVAVLTAITVSRWDIAFEKLGHKRPKSVAPYVLFTINLEGHEAVIKREKVLKVQVSSYRSAAELANYFGDRLPQAFYERYANILVEIPDVPAYEA